MERYNQVLGQLLRCTLHQVGDGAHWTKLLPTIQFAANSSPNRSTGYTPFFLNFGQHPTSPLQLLDSTISTKTEAVNSFLNRLRTQFQKARDNMKIAADQMKTSADRHRRDVVYPIGIQVLLSTRHLKPRGAAKLQRRFAGPFRIIECIGNSA